MVRLLLNKDDILNIMSWVASRISDADEYGVKFDVTEQKTLDKIKKQSGMYGVEFI